MASAAEYLALSPDARGVVKAAASSAPILSPSQARLIASLVRGSR